MYLPPWFPTWSNDRTPLSPQARAWLTHQPEHARKLLTRFPPSCVVRASRELYCPAPGDLAIVVAYDPSRARVCVVSAPDDAQRVWCRADWLEVVAYWNDLTPDFLRELWHGSEATQASLA